MWNIVKLCTAVIISHLLVCCATSPPPAQENARPGEVFVSGLDSLYIPSYDFLFIQLHTDIIKELQRLEVEHQSSARLIEARSVVRTAEQIYLEGNYIVAIKLLTEVKEILRTVP
ncbi:MAG: hypothetical protein KAX13_09540 [Candidatus Krumholzibacteria bacterium]|nr:hypothetical protein [Candidatus Krumholzibacteria bacterium]